MVLPLVLLLFTFASCEDIKYSSVQPFSTSKVLRVAPVKISSAEGQPLLAFYMVGSSLEPRIQVFMDSEFSASFQYSVVCKTQNVSFMLDVSTGRDNVKVKGQSRFPLSCNNALERYVYPTTSRPQDNISDSNTASEKPLKVFLIEGEINVNLQTDVIGYGTINIRLLEAVDSSVPVKSTTDSTFNTTTDGETDVQTDDSDAPHISYTVTIVRKIRPVDSIFRVVVYCVQIFVATGFGAKLDLQVVKECLFKPIAPAIGLGSQFLLMPLVSFHMMFCW